MQKFHLVPRCLYLAEREAAAVVEGLRRGGERLPRARVLLGRQPRPALMLLEQRPRRVTIDCARALLVRSGCSLLINSLACDLANVKEQITARSLSLQADPYLICRHVIDRRTAVSEAQLSCSHLNPLLVRFATNAFQ